MSPEVLLARFDCDALVARSHTILDASRAWESRVVEGVEVASGPLDAGAGVGHRSVVTLGATPADVAELLADHGCERLGEWNREFRWGQVLCARQPAPNRRTWLVHVRYGTPFPLADREYVYVLIRDTEPDGSELIAYGSVDPEGPTPAPRAVRARLDATVHRCVPDPRGTRLEHVLVTDLAGAFPRWVQRHLLREAMHDALVRDARAQAALFP